MADMNLQTNEVHQRSPINIHIDINHFSDKDDLRFNNLLLYSVQKSNRRCTFSTVLGACNCEVTLRSRHPRKKSGPEIWRTEK